MKSVSPQLADHLKGPTTTLATCWSIQRRDGGAFHFTDHDRDIAFDGTTFQARIGYARSAITHGADLSVDHLDVDGLFDSAAIREQDMRAGLFDHAEVRIFLVNWRDPSMGRLRLRRGWLGEVTLTQHGTFRTELRGLTQALQQTIAGLFTPQCRADLGDPRCQVDLGALTETGTVVAVETRTALGVTITGEVRPTGYWDGGVLTWTSGPNTGRAIEVKTWDAASGRIETWLPAGYPVEIGHQFTVHPGCDKRLVTCRDRYANVINFRGEPHLPGLDAIMRTPDAV